MTQLFDLLEEYDLIINRAAGRRADAEHQYKQDENYAARTFANRQRRRYCEMSTKRPSTAAAAAVAGLAR